MRVWSVVWKRCWVRMEGEEASVHGGLRVGWSLRFKSAERSGLEVGVSMLTVDLMPCEKREWSFDKFSLRRWSSFFT